MKILMLGNSLTTANHMPEMLAQKLDAEVTVHARGGARLAEQLNPDTKMGARTARVLRERNFDYVILQEMSHGPATATERYLDSVRKLARLVREAGAVPVLYATWAFRPGCGFGEPALGSGLGEPAFARQCRRGVPGKRLRR